MISDYSCSSHLEHTGVQCDEEGCCLVVTTGGTGPAVRDVTPEATEAVCVISAFDSTISWAAAVQNRLNRHAGL